MDQGDKPVPPLRQLFWRHLRLTACGIWRAMLSGVCDVCSPNLWRVADAPHIVPADSVERQRHNS